ncbi:MAG: InlB B-repeat-containing protein [Clostridia bacterium]|nr:InlB B-repeat-containing protein [Clostridia bacterium]
MRETCTRRTLAAILTLVLLLTTFVFPADLNMTASVSAASHPYPQLLNYTDLDSSFSSLASSKILPAYRDYVLNALKYHIESDEGDYRVAKNIMKAYNANEDGTVIFFFDGCSINLNGTTACFSGYMKDGYRYNMSAVAIVVQKNSSGRAQIMFASANVSTMPDNVRNASLNDGTPPGILRDGIYNVITTAHGNSYAALNIVTTANSHVRCCTTRSAYLSQGSGINIHRRAYSYSYITTSTKNSTGCFNVGGANTDKTEYNNFIKSITGYSNAGSGYSGYTTGKLIGITIVDRSNYKSRLQTVYGNDSDFGISGGWSSSYIASMITTGSSAWNTAINSRGSTHTVTFKNWDGTVLKTQAVEYGGSATAPGNPARTGYTFTGWDKSFTNVKSDLTVTALFNINTYTVSYNASGGTGAPANQTKTYNSNLTLSSTVPSKSFIITYDANGGKVSPSKKYVSCTFNNWKSSSDGAVYAPGGVYSANAATTMTAQWAAPSSGTLSTPKKTGYVFEGWFTASTGGTKITASSVITANTTVYAQWSVAPDYAVSYSANGGTGAPQSGDASYVSFTVPSRDGYAFVGWNTEPDGTGTYFGSGDPVTTALDLYAIWVDESLELAEGKAYKFSESPEEFDSSGKYAAYPDHLPGNTAAYTTVNEWHQGILTDGKNADMIPYSYNGESNHGEYVAWMYRQTGSEYNAVYYLIDLGATYDIEYAAISLHYDDANTYKAAEPAQVRVAFGNDFTHMNSGTDYKGSTYTYASDSILENSVGYTVAHSPNTASDIENARHMHWYRGGTVKARYVKFYVRVNDDLYPRIYVDEFKVYGKEAHTFKVGAYVNGEYRADISGVGTFDVRLGDSVSANDATAFSSDSLSGAVYYVDDVKASGSYVYKGYAVVNGADEPAVVPAFVTGYPDTPDMTVAAQNPYDRDNNVIQTVMDELTAFALQSDKQIILFFEQKATVTYNANGGTGAPEEEETEFVSYTVPEREGYTFVGWNTKADGTGEYFAGGDESGTSLTLYAVWADESAEIAQCKQYKFSKSPEEFDASGKYAAYPDRLPGETAAYTSADEFHNGILTDGEYASMIPYSYSGESNHGDYVAWMYRPEGQDGNEVCFVIDLGAEYDIDYAAISLHYDNGNYYKASSPSKVMIGFGSGAAFSGTGYQDGSYSILEGCICYTVGHGPNTENDIENARHMHWYRGQTVKARYVVFYVLTENETYPRIFVDEFKVYGTQKQDETLPGDVNGDGSVDSLDASFIFRYDAGLIDLDSRQIKAADVNGDNEADSLDATMVLKYDDGLIDSSDLN